MLTGRMTSQMSRLTKYEIKVTIPVDSLNDAATLYDRIVLATTLFIDLMEGVPKWRVIEADYDADEPWIKAEMQATRFKGLKSGKATVEVLRLEDG